MHKKEKKKASDLISRGTKELVIRKYGDLTNKAKCQDIFREFNSNEDTMIPIGDMEWVSFKFKRFCIH